MTTSNPVPNANLNSLMRTLELENEVDIAGFPISDHFNADTIFWSEMSIPLCLMFDIVSLMGLVLLWPHKDCLNSNPKRLIHLPTMCI